MIRFESDYTQGAVPEIINRLVETNLEMTPGYGTDHYCISAAEKIKAEINMPTADVCELLQKLHSEEETQQNLVCFLPAHMKIWPLVLSDRKFIEEY